MDKELKRLYDKKRYPSLAMKKYEQCRQWRVDHPDDWSRIIKTNQYKRRIFISKLKNKPCVDCKGWYEPCQMDFDHRDPKEKVHSISWLAHCRLSLLLKEIAKCDLVCANCHRLRSAKKGGWYAI